MEQIQKGENHFPFESAPSFYIKDVMKFLRNKIAIMSNLYVGLTFMISNEEI